MLWAKNAHKEQAILKITIVLANVLLTILLIKWKPLMGATIGTFVSLMLGDVLAMNIIFKKKIGISFKEYYAHLLKGILPCLLMLIGSGLFIIRISISGWEGLVLKVAMSCVIYAACLWLFGMNRYEKRLVLSLIKR